MATRSEPGMSVAVYESKQREISIELLEYCSVFMKHDTDVIGNLARITQTIADYIAKNPNSLVGSGDRRAFASLGGEGGGLASAADDVTGGDALDTIERIIDLVKTALGDEKPFIKDIIKHVLGIG